MNLQRVEFKRNPPREKLDTLAALVRDFLWRFPRDRRDLIPAMCEGAQDLRTAVDMAVRSIQPNGKMHSHQVKVRLEARLEFGRLLRAELRKAVPLMRFHSLWLIADAIKPWGIGDLTVYDVATRVGAYFHLEPEYLYLHTGARQGYVAMLDGMAEPHPDRGELWVEPDYIPVNFARHMKVDDFEDFLCTYRDMLDSLTNYDL